MKLRLKILLLFMSLALTMSLMSDTYSRYVANTTGNLEVQFAKWKLLVNNVDITDGNTSSIELTPVMQENSNVAENKIAPSSIGYFDIDVDPSNVELSFDYTITLDVLNEDLPDLLISKYSIIDDKSIDENSITMDDVIDNKITDTLVYNNKVDENGNKFSFSPFTIRVFFEWFDGETATMSDEMDTLVGTSEDVTSLQIQANIKFEQNITALPEEENSEGVITPSDDVIE